jgi:hypothetical protein
LKYLGRTATNQNFIRRKWGGENSSNTSIQKLLSSRLLSKNIKIRIYVTIILPVVLYRCETWSLTLREEHRFWGFENRMLSRIFGPKEKFSSCWSSSN